MVMGRRLGLIVQWGMIGKGCYFYSSFGPVFIENWDITWDARRRFEKILYVPERLFCGVASCFVILLRDTHLFYEGKEYSGKF